MRFVRCMFLLGSFSYSANALATAQYALSCNMYNGTAKVFAYNSGNSAEGENQYILVTACDTLRRCQRTLKLMYVYATPNHFREIGYVRFNASKHFCAAAIRQ